MVELTRIQIGVIGAGAIGGAVIDRLVTGTGVRPENIIACEIDDAKRESAAQRFHVRITTDPCDAFDAALIVLAVPPPAISNVLEAVQGRLAHYPVIVSFAAAVPLSFLESAVPDDVPVLRVNPNSPSLVGAGYNPVIYGSSFSDDARSLADAFLSALGTSIGVPDEQMNLYTALTAVGPTYFLPVLDALITVGIEGGLTREAAVAAAVETARGTAALVENRTETPEELKLYTGLRPLKDEEVRYLVKEAAVDAFGRMTDVQKKVTGSS